jgi:subfamily B ATP-binding cassette protein MsbA
MKTFLKRFSPYCRDYVPRFLLAGLGMVMVAVATGFAVSLIKPVLDEIFVEKDRQKLMVLPVLVVIAYLAQGFGRFIQSYQMAYIGEDIVRRIRDLMLANVIGLDLAFFNKQRGGELISRITNDIARIRMAVSQYTAVVAREGLVILALIGVAFYRSPRLTLYGLIVIPAATYPLLWLARRMKALSHRSQEKDSDITSRLTEIFNNMEIIKAHSSEDYELDSFKSDNLEFQRINMKGVKIRELTSPLMEFIGSIAVAVIIIVGGVQVIEERMTVGTFFSFSSAFFLLYTPIKRISMIYNRVHDAVAASERIFDMVERKPTIRSGSQVLSEPIRSLELRDVSFSYGGEPAIDGISCRVCAGETLALVGDSGGGKTTLVNLILRLYDPTAGAVLVNGIDARELDLTCLRDRIGIVTQRIFIFNETIAANVAYGSKKDPQRVKQALVQAGAWEFVSRLEQGMDAKIDEFGANLSGGERQRLAIARALYKNPDILILDEATSALDNRSEAAIQEALAGVIKDKITFVIAHRLSTVDLADRILVIKGGRIVGAGSKEELLRTCPEYQHLVNGRKETSAQAAST